LLFASIVVSLLFLLSCNSTEPDVTEEFSIELELTNTAGTPLEGYQVTIYQKDYRVFISNFYHRPQATIVFSNQNPYFIRLEITDYFDNLIRTLGNQSFEAGTHVMSWDGENELGEVVRDGIYKIKAKYYDDDNNLIFQDRFLAYKLGEFDAYHSQYITDTNGKVQSTDKVPFPKLYCNEDIHIYDDMTEFLGYANFSATSDTMVVVVTAPDETSRHHYFRIRNAKNVLNLNWDTMLYDQDKTTLFRNLPTLPDAPIQPKATQDDLTNNLKCCFPNAFN